MLCKVMNTKTEVYIGDKKKGEVYLKTPGHEFETSRDRARVMPEEKAYAMCYANPDLAFIRLER
jgi:hypothetical protein